MEESAYMVTHNKDNKPAAKKKGKERFVPLVKKMRNSAFFLLKERTHEEGLPKRKVVDVSNNT